MEEDEVADTGGTTGESKVWYKEADKNEPLLPEDGRSALHVAAVKGDKEEVKKLLRLGALADMPDYTENTALHYAAQEGHVDVVRVLLDSTSDLDIRNDEGATALCMAVDANQKEVVKVLLNKGANVFNVKWCSILLTAMEERDEDFLKVAFACKVPVNVMEATQSGIVDLIKYAIEAIVQSSYYYNTYDTDLEMNMAFHLAVIAGKSELVELFLTYNVDLEKCMVNVNTRNTPLLNALLNEHYEIADKLLEKGANIDAFDGLALRKAAEMGNVDIVKFLLNKNVNLNLRGPKEMTPLHIAVSNNHYEIVELLLQKKADVNTANYQGESPLYTAVEINSKRTLIGDYIIQLTESQKPPVYVEANNVKIINLLIEKGANLNVELYGRTLFDFAMRNAIPIAKTLLDAGVELTGPSSSSFLHLATSLGDVDLCRKLLDKGVPVDSTDYRGNTPLFEVLRSRDGNLKLELIKMFLSYGANVQHTNVEGFQPMLIQAKNCEATPSDHQLVELLIEKGGLDKISSNIHLFELLNYAFKRNHNSLLNKILNRDDLEFNQFKSGSGDTVLHLAAKNGRVDVIKTLLGKGVNVNVANGCGVSPLHEACRHKELKAAELLLEKGALLNMLDDSRRSPVHWVINNKDVSLYGLCINHESFDDQPDPSFGTTMCHVLAEANYLELMKLYLAKGNEDNVNIQDNDGNTAFHISINRSHVDMSCLISKYVTDPDKRNKNGYTPLMLAVGIMYISGCRNLDLYKVDGDQEKQSFTADDWEKINQKIELAKFILELGGQIDLQNVDGNTALHISVFQNNVQMTKILLENGANMNKKDNNGFTVLHFAAQVGNHSLLKLLLENIMVSKQGKDEDFEDNHISFRKTLQKTEVTSQDLINTTTSSGKTPLHLAIENFEKRYLKTNFENNVQLLIDSGADVNVKDSDGVTPLMVATSHSLYDDKCRLVAEKLFKSGAVVDFSDSTQTCTLFNNAIRLRYMFLIEHIMENIVNIDMQDNKGNTALHAAVREYWQEGRCELVASLLDRGANVNIANEEGDTVLHIIASNPKNTEVIGQLTGLIMLQANVDALNNKNQTPLHTVLGSINFHCKGAKEFIQLLIENKASLNMVDGAGNTPVDIAIAVCYNCSFHKLDKNNCSYCVDILQLLLNKGAQVGTEKDGQVNKFMRAAFEFNRHDLVKTLGNGINLKCKSIFLIFAGRKKWYDIIEDWLTQGGDCNKLLGYNNGIFLTFCLIRGDDKLIDIVLENASYLDLGNLFDEQDLFSVVRNYSKLLPKKGSDNLDKYFFKQSLERRQFGKALMLLDKGIALDVKDDRGCSPLHLAVESGSLVMVNILLGKGVDVDLLNNYGETALHEACSTSRVDIARVLIEHGASTNAQDNRGQSPLHTGLSCGLEFTKLLLDNNAFVDMRDVDGETPLLKALQPYNTPDEERYDIVKLLIEKGADCSVLIENQSLLLRAIVSGNLELQYFIDNGAKVGSQITSAELLSELSFDSASKEHLEVLCKHVLKLNLAGLAQDSLKVIQNILTDNEGMIETTFFVTCLMELNKIKSTEIYEGFTLNKVFSNYHKPKPKFLLEENTVERLDALLQSPSLPERFPMYGYILRNAYKEMKCSRFYLLHLSSVSMMKETRKPHLRRLDELAKYNIFKCLSDDDLKSLIKSE